jgi:hypothetical protein
LVADAAVPGKHYTAVGLTAGVAANIKAGVSYADGAVHDHIPVTATIAVAEDNPPQLKHPFTEGLVNVYFTYPALHV